MRENFIYARTKNAFRQQLEAGNILEDAIVFIEDTQEVWTHGMYFGVDLRDYYDKDQIDNLIVPMALKSEIPTKISQVENDLEYATLDQVTEAVNLITSMQGINSASSLTNLEITKEIIIVTINSSQSFSLKSIPSTGKDIHILIHNVSSTEVVITIPNSGKYVNVNNSTQLTILPGGWSEINALSDGSVVYVRAV